MLGYPPPPPGSLAVWVNGGAPDAARARRGDLAVWPDQAAAASAPSGLSLVRDILELNYCTKFFHQTVHALSARLCKTRRNIGVSRGKHHSNKTAFSIAFFCALFSAFSRICCQSRRTPPPPPTCKTPASRMLGMRMDYSVVTVFYCDVLLWEIAFSLYRSCPFACLCIPERSKFGPSVISTTQLPPELATIV